MTIAAVLAAASAAPGAGAADDVSVNVFLRLGNTLTRVTGPNFQIVVEVDSRAAVIQSVTVRVTLPPGLRWGNSAPSAADGCTGDSPAVCTRRTAADPGGSVRANWFWDVVSAQPGVYEITSTVTPTETDPDQSNNSHTFRFEVLATSGGGGGGGGGGAAVTAGAAKLTPAKPKAGSSVAARVRVAAGGVPVKPTRIACAGTIGSAKVKGTGKAASGSATCVYRTPRAAKGKTLRGAVSFTARGKRFTKRFAAKLG